MTPIRVLRLDYRPCLNCMKIPQAELRMLTNWKERAKQLKLEIHAFYLAIKDPRTPWYARVLGTVIVGYAFSPIDLIPDPIPVLGYLDDMVLLPFGVLLLMKLLPPEVMADCRAKAAASAGGKKRTNWVAGAIIDAIWLSAIYMTVRFFFPVDRTLTP